MGEPERADLPEAEMTGEWSQRIVSSWRLSIEGIIETGRLLTAAKENLSHGRFVKMVESELPFSRGRQRD